MTSSLEIGADACTIMNFFIITLFRKATLKEGHVQTTFWSVENAALTAENFLRVQKFGNSLCSAVTSGLMFLNGIGYRECQEDGNLLVLTFLRQCIHVRN